MEEIAPGLGSSNIMRNLLSGWRIVQSAYDKGGKWVGLIWEARSHD